MAVRRTVQLFCFAGGLLACGEDPLLPLAAAPTECMDYSLCRPVVSDAPCPDIPRDVCDGRDNDCNGSVDDVSGVGGAACGAPSGPTGPTAPTGPSGPSAPTGPTGPTGPVTPTCGAADLDGDGLANPTDPDDDNDGIPDSSDEFPSHLVIDDERLDFDYDLGGTALAHGTLIAEQWSALGIHFESGFRTARRNQSYDCYAAPTLNLLCTTVGASSGMCDAPEASELVVSFESAVDFVSIELSTRCDGPDSDSGSLTAKDAQGTVIVDQSIVAGNNANPTREAIGVLSGQAPGIRRVNIRAGDFDAIDNLRIVRLANPCD